MDREKNDALEVLNSESAAVHSALAEVIDVLTKKCADVHEFNVLCSDIESNPSYNIGGIMEEAEALVISSDIEREIQELLSGQSISITTKLQNKTDKLLSIKKKLESREQKPVETKPSLIHHKSIDDDDDDIWVRQKESKFYVNLTF